MNGISFSVGLMGYGDYNNSISFGSGSSFGASVGANGGVGSTEHTGETGDAIKAGHRSSPKDCKTCKERKYQDGSDENVSLKAASHISPQAAGSVVRGHEQEHVSNAYSSAAQKGGQVINASVSIHTAVCPEWQNLCVRRNNRYINQVSKVRRTISLSQTMDEVQRKILTYKE